jgi:hypothetical protein
MYQWWMQHHLFKLYGELKLIETELGRRGVGESIDDIVSALDGLQTRVNRMFVTVSFAQRRYILKNHIQLAREQLEKRRARRRRERGVLTRTDRNISPLSALAACPSRASAVNA